VKTDAIIYPGPNAVSFGQVDIGEPEPGDALVRIIHTVLSTGTDTRILRGEQPQVTYPCVPSYSSVGVVEKVIGDGGPVRKGDRVFCGGTNKLLDCAKHYGAQVRRAIRPAAALQKLDDRAPLDHYVFTKVAAIALHGARRSFSEPGDPVFVLGQGLIGLLHARVQAAWGRDVIASDVLPGRLRRSAGGYGICTVNAREHDVAEFVRERWPEGPWVAVEASARQEGLDQCVELVRGRNWNSDDRMGAVLVQSSFMGRISLDARQFFMKEFVVVSPRDTDPRDYPAAAGMIGSGALRVGDIITCRSRPEDAPDAFRVLLENPDEHLTIVFDWD